jgi:hypothetical protein
VEGRRGPRGRLRTDVLGTARPQVLSVIHWGKVTRKGGGRHSVWSSVGLTSEQAAGQSY